MSQDPTFPSLQDQAAALLAQALDSAVRLDPGVPFAEREHVWRFRVLDGPPGAPASLIAKTWRGAGQPDESFDPASLDPWSPAALFFNEWAALEFLEESMGLESPAPRLLAGDRQRGLLLVEDLGQGLDPAQALLGDDPRRAADLLLQMMVVQGRMHALSAGQHPRYTARRALLSPYLPASDARFDELTQRWLASLSKLGLEAGGRAAVELEQVRLALAQPAEWLAFTHGDPCPDNWMLVDGRLRLFDYESSRFQHALLDGSYGAIHFPTCWCIGAIPNALQGQMEQKYRAQLARSPHEPLRRAAGDDARYGAALAAMCAFWLLVSCEGRMPLGQALMEPRRWGTATLGARIALRAGLFAQVSSRWGQLPALGELAQRLADVVRGLGAEPPGLYPAFEKGDGLDER